MASAMQKDEASASAASSSSETAAFRRWKGELKKDESNEESLTAYLGVLLDEHHERRRKLEPNKRLHFPRSSVEFGRCAISLLLEGVPLKLSRVRMKLFALICVAWIYCRADEAEEFAQVMRNCSSVEDEDAAKTLRDAITSNPQPLLGEKIADFFAHAKLPSGDSALFRTMFKAIGNNGSTSDIVLLGKAFYLLRLPDHGPELARFIDKAWK